MGRKLEASGQPELFGNPTSLSTNELAYRSDLHGAENQLLSSMQGYIVGRFNLSVAVPPKFIV